MRMFEKEGPGTIQIGLNSRNAKRMLRFVKFKNRYNTADKDNTLSFSIGFCVVFETVPLSSDNWR
ncbi:unnamed protein product [Tenebrio molitor]|nr:unnamed protein product [Tenebrio molitor]